MKPLTLCVTTANRQDMLGRCIASAYAGTRAPDRLVIVDQGRRPQAILAALNGRPALILDLKGKRGCEASAVNWYLTNVEEERIIAHDDVEFGPRSLELFCAAEGAFLIDDQQGVITYRDECVEKVGLYDTELSPNYFRYVDADYEERLAEAGIEPTIVHCGVKHARDGTMRGYDHVGLADYFRRIGIAHENYVRKWKRDLTPGGSTIGRSEWRRSKVTA